jgi:hypothetical protein
MITLETWIALGSLAMAGMFVALMFSFYSFLIGPEGRGPDVATDPGALLIQIVSISGAPSLILAGTVLGISRGPVERNPGLLLIITGLILLTGMLMLTSNTLPSISPQYHISGIDYVPFIFVIAGIGIVGCGLTTIKKKVGTRRNAEFGWS